MIREGLSNDIILQNYGIIKQSFFSIRRNISGIEFKGHSTENSIAQIDDLLLSFIKKLPSEYLGNIYSCEEKDFESRTKTFLSAYNLNSQVNSKILTQKTPFGSKLYISQGQDLGILTNYEDHFLMVFDFKAHSLLKVLQQLESIMKIFEKTTQEMNLSPAYRNGVGFLTLNPNFTGLGISLNYTLQLKEREPNEMQIELNPEEHFYNHEDVKDLLKLQLDRITLVKLEEYITFIQAKLNEQKNFLIFSKCAVDFITPQLITNYSQISIKEGLTFLDCLDPSNPENLLALHESCYDAFSGLYDSFLLHKTQMKWNPLSKEEFHKVLISFFENLPPPASLDNTFITYEIGRNLAEFPFKPFLKFESLLSLKNRLFGGLKSLKLFTLIDEKYIATSSLDRLLFPRDYKQLILDQGFNKGGLFVLVPEHNKYAIWGLLKDHIRIVLRTDPNNQQKDLVEVLEILKRIEEIFMGGFKFHKNYGYLAENATDLGFNFKFAIETEVDVKKREVLRHFCKTSNLGLEENTEGKEKTKMKLMLTRPCLLPEVLELMINLMKGLSVIE